MDMYCVKDTLHGLISDGHLITLATHMFDWI